MFCVSLCMCVRMRTYENARIMFLYTDLRLFHFVLCKFDFRLKVKFLFEAAAERLHRKNRKRVSRETYWKGQT